MRYTGLTLSLVVCLAACGSTDATCEKAVSHGMEVFAKDEDTKARWADMTPARRDEMRADMLGRCTDQKWSAKVRSCTIKAQTTKDLIRCAAQEMTPGRAEQYLKKSKGIEASMNLKRIHDGARAYYLEQQQFPVGDTGPTPAAGSCCTGGGSNKCAPAPALWETDVWRALTFTVDDPHYYSYQYIGAGADRTASFTARALGDLDCDGTYSTFELVGTVDGSGEVSGSGAIRKEQESE